MVDLTRLATLKTQLLEATEFLPVFDYFMTHFGENAQFMGLGRRTRDAMLMGSVNETFRRMTGQENPQRPPAPDPAKGVWLHPWRRHDRRPSADGDLF